MSRMLTFKDLKDLKGWPYSRQHTHKLIRAGHFPSPEKLYEGGLIRVVRGRRRRVPSLQSRARQRRRVVFTCVVLAWR